MTRDITANMLTAISGENSAILYFLQFVFGTIKDITSFADAGGGETTVTCAGHGLANGGTCTIYGTAHFDGVYTVQDVAANTFNIVRAYVSGDSVGFLDVPDTLSVTTAPHTIAWNSISWVGIGGNIGFNVVNESPDLGGSGLDVVLSGVDQSVPAIILSKKYIGRPCSIWRAHLNTSGAIVSDPLMIFSGLMNGGFRTKDVPPEHDRPGYTEITGRMTDMFGELSVLRGIQTNVESHQKFYPDDEFFRNVPGLKRKTVVVKQD